jgi:transposase
VEKGMSVKATALKLNINVHTAQGWVSKNNKNSQECVQRSFGSGRPVGRPPVLTDEHRNYMIQCADENTDSVVAEDMLDILIENFGYLQITKSGFCKFVRQKCRITFKQAHLQSVERYRPEKIEQRYE